MEARSYNEIYDDAGLKRPAVAAFEARNGCNVTRLPADLATRLNQNRSGAPIYPLPLILDDGEFRQVITPGVLQRALALQALFADIALGPGEIASGDLLDESELDHILRSEGVSLQSIRRQWKGQSREQIRFVYGPDLVRDERGRWVVLEDNVGCVGGVAAAGIVLNRFLAETGFRLHPDIAHPEAPRDLGVALLTFLRQVELSPAYDYICGIPGPRLQSAGCSYDFETVAKAATLHSLDVIVTQPEELLGEILAGARLPDALINLSATIFSSYQRLASTVFTGRDMPVFGAPSVGLVASKSFHSLGQSLITRYVDEPPLLATPATKLLRNVPDTLPREGVLKRANGCQGSEVYFLDEANHDALLAELGAWGPCGAVIQSHVRRSQIAPLVGMELGAVAVEIRPIVYVVGWRKALVADVVTARANLGDGKVGNPGRGAHYVPVIREPTSGRLGD